MKRSLTPLFLLLCLLLPQLAFSPSRQDSASDLLAEVNALRAEYGLASYAMNPILMKVAQDHAEYMASTGVVSHFGAGGSRPYQRALDAGYPLAGNLSGGGLLGQNILADKNLIAQQVVEFWKQDSQTLKPMLSEEYTEAGVGLFVKNSLTYYVFIAAARNDDAAVTQTSTPDGTHQPLVITSTPDAQGYVYHIVQPNEALWSIALAYGLSVEELQKMNRLSGNEIFVGQKLVVKTPKPADTPTLEPSVTVTLGIPTSTATKPVTPSATSTATPVPTAPASRQTSGMIVGGIVLAAMLAAGVGAWLGRGKKEENA